MAEQETIKQVDAARRFGVSERTLLRWEKRNLIVGHRIGGMKLYSLADLRKLVGVKEEPTWQR